MLTKKAEITVREIDCGKYETERLIKGANNAIQKESISEIGNNNFIGGRENNLEDFESDGLQITDPKRRRTVRPSVEKSPSDEEMLDPKQFTELDPKNSLVVDSAMQGRLLL